MAGSIDISLIEVNSDNVSEYGVCCVVNRKSPGFKAKLSWFTDILNRGVTIVVAVDSDGKQLGFIEFTDSELAWRPVRAENHLFIHCIYVFSKGSRNNDIGSRLIQHCEELAAARGKEGICTMTSSGVWMASKLLFEKNGYDIIDKVDRFELMHKKLKGDAQTPEFNNWNAELAKYQGWNIVYSDQCPWKSKSVSDISQYAQDLGIDLIITKLVTPLEAQRAPSAYGTYALIKDGKLLADHYISKTRFQNILKKELK